MSRSPYRVVAKTANVRARIEPRTKEQAEHILAELGLTMSAAIQLFLREVVSQGGLPFELKVKK